MAKTIELRQVKYPDEFLEKAEILLPGLRGELAKTPEPQWGRVIGNRINSVLAPKSPLEIVKKLTSNGMDDRSLARSVIDYGIHVHDVEQLKQDNKIIRRSFGYA